jgi:hypothetical protein
MIKNEGFKDLQFYQTFPHETSLRQPGDGAAAAAYSIWVCAPSLLL